VLLFLQVLIGDLRELRGLLNNLIWKGSNLAASVRLKDLDIKGTLKQLEEKWQGAVHCAEQRLEELETLRLEWIEREQVLGNMEVLVKEAEDQMTNEKSLTNRDEGFIRDALQYYEVSVSIIGIRKLPLPASLSVLVTCNCC
jgi:hypothetical protein